MKIACLSVHSPRAMPALCAIALLVGARHARLAVIALVFTASVDAATIELAYRAAPSAAVASDSSRSTVLVADRRTVAYAKLTTDARDAIARCRKLPAESKTHCEHAEHDRLAGRALAMESLRPVSIAPGTRATANTRPAGGAPATNVAPALALATGGQRAPTGVFGIAVLPGPSGRP